MRLEDALLLLDVEIEDASPDLIEAAIAGGVDLVVMPAALDAVTAQSIFDVCRKMDALCMVTDDLTLANSVDVDGICLSSTTAEVGHAKVVVGMDRSVGMVTRTLDEARMALEIGVDFIVHEEGSMSPATFSSLPRAAGVYYAGGLDGQESARGIVEAGIYRLAVKSRELREGDPAERAAGYSRILGRCM